MGGAGWFFLILFLLVAAYGGWLGFKIWNARKRGERLQGWQAYIPFMKISSSGSTTNYPTPRSAGPLEWIKGRISALSNKRSQKGGYEGARGEEGQYQGLNSGARGGRGGRSGPEDDAWDSRVGGRDDDPYGPGPGGYNEEAELGLAPAPGPSGAGNTSGGMHGQGGDYMSQQTGYGGASRGRSSERDSAHLDPFADSNQAPSLRSVSPRPELSGTDMSKGHKRMESYDDGGNTSPISTRKSIFSEDVK